MKLFINPADSAQIKEVGSWGIIDRVTILGPDIFLEEWAKVRVQSK